MKTNMNQMKSAKARQRKIAISDGFYDGRYKMKIVPNKKKERSRKSCKNFAMEWRTLLLAQYKL